MRKWHLGIAAGLSAASLLLTACGGSSTTSPGTASTSGTSTSGASAGAGDASKAYVGVILPDTKSSARWTSADAPLLKAAFESAGVKYDIQNAQGDKSQFQTIADSMITEGVNVLMIVNLDSGSGKAVIDKATSAGVATIDYDRLTLGGGAQYYVSFDNVQVGKLQGQGLVACLKAKGTTKPVVAELNGSPTDNNATLFAQGYNSVLDPLYQDGTLVKGPNQSVPDWDNEQGGTIFEQMLTKTGGKIDGVLAANDGLGNAAIAILKKNNLQIPVTGQDATAQGLQNILSGDQCMTVYKPIKQEADAASKLAISLANGQKESVPNTVQDPTSKKAVPSVLLTPVSITIDNVKQVVDDGFVTKADLCTGTYAALCTKAGIQ